MTQKVLLIFRGFSPGRVLLCAVAVVCLAFPVQPVSAEIVGTGQIGGFKSPTRIAVSESGDIYVADYRNGTVEVFDTELNKKQTIGGFYRPLGVAVYQTPSTIECGKYKKKENDNTGNQVKCKNPTVIPGKTVLYVGDERDGSVQIFTDGVKTGHLGSGPGEFIKPNAIAVTSDQTVYVVNSRPGENTGEVKVFDSSGDEVGFIGGFVSPTDIAINETAGLSGELYVAEFNMDFTYAAFGKIRVFDLDGSPLRDIAAPSNDSGDPIFHRPAGLGIDQDGNLYVVDNGLSCVVKITRLGDLLDTIGYINSPPAGSSNYWTGELAVPIDAAVYGTKIFVTSNYDGQLKIFEEVLP
jgi:DNA-binding beta-propeller fold protein YncE